MVTAFVHEHTIADALAEEFIEGREFYVGVLGNDRLQTLPIWELMFTKSDAPIIATRKVKWDRNYQERLGVKTDMAQGLDAALQNRISRMQPKLLLPAIPRQAILIRSIAIVRNT